MNFAVRTVLRDVGAGRAPLLLGCPVHGDDVVPVELLEHGVEAPTVLERDEDLSTPPAGVRFSGEILELIQSHDFLLRSTLTLIRIYSIINEWHISPRGDT